MNGGPRRSRPSWRVPEGRAIRPELWLVAAATVGMLLVEVCLSSRVAELSLDLDRNRTALVAAQARLEFVNAQLERQTTRATLAPLAVELGLSPADARQVVVLPAAYLAAARPPARSGDASSIVAWAERVSRALVPDATARSRGWKD
jgi:hypothetical protein